MEQQSQARARPEETRELRESRETGRRSQGHERVAQTGHTAQALLQGAPMLDLPPARLEELAGWLGNSGMAALLAAQGPPLEEAELRFPTGEADTEPFPVPETAPALTEPPMALAGPVSGRAFDPAGLWTEGGEPHGPVL